MTAFLPPDWSPSDTATVVLFLSLLGAAVTALVIGGRYIAGRMRRWDYPDQFTPEAAEVARRMADNDVLMEVELIIDDLNDALGMLRTDEVAA